MIIIRSFENLDIVYWTNFSGNNHIISHAHYALKHERVTLCGREINSPDTTRYSASTRQVVRGQKECSPCLRRLASGQL